MKLKNKLKLQGIVKMWQWLFDTLDNWNYMSAKTGFENPKYGNQDRTEEFLKGFKLKQKGD